MGFLYCSHCCFLVFLISTEMRFICSTPVLMLSDLKKTESVALPTGENGQITNAIPMQQGNEIITPNPPSELGKLLGSRIPQGKTNGINQRYQSRNTRPKTSLGKHAFMQLRESRGTAKHSLPSKQNSNALQPPLKPERNLRVQEEDNNPSNPQAHSKNSEEVLNSVGSPQTVVHDDLPLKNGLSLINLGHLDLKTDFCTGYQFKETIRHHGCISASVDNKMCYGQCNSFYIPKRFVSCSFCVPSELETYEVRLECPGQNPAFVVKKVSIVKDCGCKDCGLQHP